MWMCPELPGFQICHRPGPFILSGYPLRKDVGFAILAINPVRRQNNIRGINVARLAALWKHHFFFKKKKKGGGGREMCACTGWILSCTGS